MKRQLTRWIALFLAIGMCLSLTPAWAAESAADADADELYVAADSAEEIGGGNFVRG